MTICIHVFYYACFAFGDGISKPTLELHEKSNVAFVSLHYAYYLEYSIPFLSW